MKRPAFTAALLALCLCAVASDKGHVTKVLPTPDRPAALVKAHVLPDPKLTPGAVYSDVTLADIKRPNFSASDRDVPESVHKEVFRRYGIDYAEHSKYEVDHAVELACGGSNAVENLWPQPLHLNVGGRDMGAIEKDKVEKKVLAGVRDGSLPLKETQIQLAKDWTVLYRKLVSPEFPPFK